ncbi:unnamed protein product, partial [Didymodactylos carnosus]
MSVDLTIRHRLQQDTIKSVKVDKINSTLYEVYESKFPVDEYIYQIKPSKDDLPGALRIEIISRKPCIFDEITV